MWDDRIWLVWHVIVVWVWLEKMSKDVGMAIRKSIVVLSIPTLFSCFSGFLVSTVFWGAGGECVYGWLWLHSCSL